MPVTHDFNRSLSKAARDAKLPCWDAWYRQAWPQLDEAKEIDNFKWQKLGIDRALFAHDGDLLALIEEKLRDRDHGDVLLEFVSNDVAGTPGWVEKKQESHVCAYAIRETGVCHLFPTKSLQEAWAANGERWKALYGVKAAKNYGRYDSEEYQTLSCPVPLVVLCSHVPGYRAVECDPALCCA